MKKKIKFIAELPKEVVEANKIIEQKEAVEQPKPIQTKPQEIKQIYVKEKLSVRLKKMWWQSKLKRWLELNIWYAQWYKQFKASLYDITINLFVVLFNSIGLLLVLHLLVGYDISVLNYVCTVALYFFIQEIPEFVRRTIK